MLSLLLLIQTSAAIPTPEDSMLNRTESQLQLRPVAELGMLAPRAHTIQYGSEGTEFDYIEEGGQDNLYFFSRWSMDLYLPKRHSLTFLYQPLDIQTSVEAERQLQFNDLVIPQGTPLDTRWGFEFYRVSWARDVLKDESAELSLGFSMQFRNATIDFTTADGEIRDTTRDIGLVPLFKAKGRFDHTEAGWWWGFEADGAYAPIKYINGDTSDVLGALLDSSIRAGYYGKQGIDPFLNIRYVGGGAEGTTNDPDPGEDGFTSNWLHFLVFSMGFMVR
jgi:hypothetical protein